MILIAFVLFIYLFIDVCRGSYMVTEATFLTVMPQKPTSSTQLQRVGNELSVSVLIRFGFKIHSLMDGWLLVTLIIDN